MNEPGRNGAMHTADEESSEGLDLESVREMAGFVFHAIWRRRKLALLTFFAVAALGLTAAFTMPRTYNAQVKLLAQQSAIHALTGQNALMEDSPTKNVAAMILRRDNLVALAKEADLVRRFDETRPAALRFKDHVMARLFGSLSDADKLNIMVQTLESKLTVTVEESTVTISVDWSNPRLAYDLVTLVQKNFLEARYDSDVAVINDSIALLEEHAKSELAQVDMKLDEYQKLVATKTPPPKADAPGSAPDAPRDVQGAMGGIRPAPDTRPPGAPAGADIATAHEETRVRIRAIETARQQMTDSVRQRLGEAQLTLTPMHPTVIALQQQLGALSQPSPELEQLKVEERSLMAQLAAVRVDPFPPSLPALPTRPAYHTFLDSRPDAEAPSAESLGALPAIPIDRDGTVQLAQSQLALAIRAYEDALVRLDTTKVELDVTGAAYKHLYTVVTPAEVPRGPKKPTAQLVGVGSVLGGALLALLLTTGLDVLGGLVLEPWQVRRRLKLDVLGELDNPS